MHFISTRLSALLIFSAFQISMTAADFLHAVVVAPPNLTGPERKAVTLLVEEAEKRTHVRWTVVESWPTNSNATVFALGQQSQFEWVAGPFAADLAAGKRQKAAEGFEIHVRQEGGTTAAIILGADPRGVLFGVGRILRELHLEVGSASLPVGFDLASAPVYPLRGHQLGYRPKCNSYDAWDLPVWEQYIRDMVIFGCNAIELIPPRSDDDSTSPHFPRPPQEMMVGMSQLAADYGLDLWIWFPAMDPDYNKPETVASAVQEWGDLFKLLPRIDAVFVPGGDPGHTPPKDLMNLLEKQSKNLQQYHPKGRIWVSPQGFNQEWLTDFLTLLESEKPAWLGGIVHGPQVRISLPTLRRRIPQEIPIRQYPDITHSRQCQYPVPDWDTAFAITEARECINPRPVDEAAIFHQTQPGTVGFISYSEGCNDDVNKFIWLGLGWDPDAAPIDILRDYSSWFLGPHIAEGYAQGLMALERNWRGPLLANEAVETTLAQFQSLEKQASPALLRNWRFQQGLFRADYDAYLRRRLLYETELESQAIARLSKAETSGSLDAMRSAEGVLARSSLIPESGVDLRQRIQELGEALFQSIGMQLSVGKYQAIAIDRGAALDTLDFPLNNRAWLVEQFARVRKLEKEPDRLAALDAIVHWTNPGPGGFYDDLGNPARQPHLVRGVGFERDPGSYSSPRSDWEEDIVQDDDEEVPAGARRLSWIDHAESLYDAPLRMHYSGLDSKARYRLRVVYAGDAPKKKIRLTTGGDQEIHPFIQKPFPFKPLEFTVPTGAIEDGELDLTWTGEPGLGGNGRGCQVSEVWLIRESKPPLAPTKP